MLIQYRSMIVSHYLVFKWGVVVNVCYRPLGDLLSCVHVELAGMMDACK